MILIGDQEFEHALELRQFVRGLLGKYGPEESISDEKDQEFIRAFLAADPQQAKYEPESITSFSIVRNRKTKMTDLALRYTDGSETQVSYMSVLANISH